ncbi:MAG: helix-turn-helix domain-containing protein [Solirubrobacteraceae bacterium]
MPRNKNKNWREVRAQRPLDERRVTAFRRLMDAETTLHEIRERRGVSQAKLAAALEMSQPNVSRIESEDDVYLSTLARYVAALGGHIEVSAVFPDETVTVLSDPEPEPEPIASEPAAV